MSTHEGFGTRCPYPEAPCTCRTPEDLRKARKKPAPAKPARVKTKEPT